jgi:carboxyl-terminal processing protease
VQPIIPLGEGGGALRLTTARYYTPSGHSIQAQGIIPDVAVAQGDEDDIPRIARPSEADLPGHFANGDAAVRHTMPSIIRPPTSAQKPADFQLAYAIDFLHGKVSLPTTKSAQAN